MLAGGRVPKPGLKEDRNGKGQGQRQGHEEEEKERESSIIAKNCDLARQRLRGYQTPLGLCL
jgi:hypothetical protein